MSTDKSDSNDPFLPKSNLYSPPPLYCWGMFTKRGVICTSVAWLLTILAILLTVFLGAESLAKESVHDSSIYMYQMTMKSFSSNAIITDIESGMDNRSPFTATIKSTNFNLQYKGRTFGTINFPKFNLETGQITELDFENLQISITSTSAFNDFSLDLLSHKTLSMSLQGKVPLSTKGLDYKFSTTQVVEIAGMQNLSASGYEPYVWEITFGETGPNMLQFSMLVQIYNPSIVSFDDIEGLNFTMAYDYNGEEVEIGYAVCLNDTIPLNIGYNYYLMKSVIIRTSSTAAAIEDMLSSFAEGKTQTFLMKGNDQTTPITLLQPSMSQFKMPVTFVGLDVLRTGQIPSEYFTPTTFDESPISIIVSQTFGSFVLNRPLMNEKSLYQGVFANLNIVQIGSSSDTQNCSSTQTHAYLDTVLLLFNPMNATMGYYDWNVEVFMELNFTYNGELFDNEIFAVASSPIKHTSDTPVFTIPPLSTAFYKQRICLTGSSTDIINKSFYLYFQYGLTQQTFPLNFYLAGKYTVSIGEFYITIPYNQTVRAYNAFT